MALAEILWVPFSCSKSAWSCWVSLFFFFFWASLSFSFSLSSLFSCSDYPKRISSSGFSIKAIATSLRAFSFFNSVFSSSSLANLPLSFLTSSFSYPSLYTRELESFICLSLSVIVLERFWVLSVRSWILVMSPFSFTSISLLSFL